MNERSGSDRRWLNGFEVLRKQEGSGLSRQWT